MAFLGPNGAGKSTTMKLLTGYLAPSAGSARIAGHDMQDDRLDGSACLGYLPENGPLYPDMTPHSLLEFFADARGMDRATEGRADRCRDRSLCVGKRGLQADQQAVQGVSPARGDGAGAAARARRADPGRADGRSRSQPDSRRSRTMERLRESRKRSCCRRTFCRKSRRWPAA